MPDQIIFTDTISNVTLNAGDDYVLGAGVSHVGDTFSDPVVDVTGTGDNRLNVAGNIFQLGTDYAISVAATAEEVVISIGSTGGVFGSANIYTISMQGNDHILTNAGLISGIGGIITSGDGQRILNSGEIQTSFPSAGTVNAVRIFGNNNFFTNSGTIDADRAVTMQNVSTMINSGTITSLEDAVFFDHLVGTASFLNNSGTIISSRGDAIQGDFGSETIYNTGSLLGSLSLLAGNDYLNNSGTIAGFIDMDFGSDTLRNSGLISGDVDMGEATNVVVNSGTIDGDVDFGNSADRYTGAGNGLVTGTVFGGGNDDTLRGSDLVDDFRGGTGDDNIIGGAGNDSLRGDEDNDFVSGGSGDDTISGGSGVDTLVGNGGDDEISAGDDNDRIVSGTGNDTLRGEGGNDNLRAGSGIDSLEGGGGTDFLFGDSDDDELLGGDDNDFLRGGSGNDFLDGGDGVDDLRGNAGDDALFGGIGADRLYGGSGADAFVYTSAAQSTLGNIDTIFDFRQGEDVIDLEGFIGFFDFVGTSGFAGGGTSSIRYIDTVLGVSVRADVDGNGTEDLQLNVRNLDVLTADDFIL